MVNFKQMLEKATNAEHSEPDWEVVLEIVEEVKSKNVTAKNAVKEFKRRIQESGGDVLYHTVLVLESLMKNCTSDVHTEILTTDFLTVIKDIITSSKEGRSEKAVDKALELIGEWKSAFGQQTGYKAINTVFAELERGGYHIPTATVATAAFIKKPPEWVLSDRCFMCRQEFNRFKGKLRHHCRNCGKSVCALCSAKRTSLPHFGVDEPSRVCDICFKKVEKGEGESAASAAADMSSDLPVEYLRSSLAQESQTPSTTPTGTGTQQQTEEDDELQLAIAMSLNEQENKSFKKLSPSPASAHPSSTPTPPPHSATPSAPTQSTLYASIIHEPTPSQEPSTTTTSYSNGHQQEASGDPLARYLDRSYWEQRKEQQAAGTGQSRGLPPPSPSSPTPTARHTGPEAVVIAQQEQGPTGSLLAESIRNSIDMFVKRLLEVNGSGGSIATDPVVLSLYQNLTAMQPQLLKQIDDVQQQKSKQVAFVNKLNEAKEARITLNKMRREHQDKVKQMEQEQSMLARMQMEQKLALLRQQKQEQLVFQQSLQQKRLEALHSQRAEYEQKVSMQRELERQHLIVQEQKVIQHQFGSSRGGGVNTGTSTQTIPQTAMTTQQFHNMPLGNDKKSQIPSMIPPGSIVGAMDPYTMPMQSLSMQEQAPPLPTKLDYGAGISSTPITGGMDSVGPPPYNPGDVSAGGTGIGMSFGFQDPPPSIEYTSHHQFLQQHGTLPHLRRTPLPTQQQAPATTTTTGLQASQSGSQHSMDLQPSSGFATVPTSTSYESIQPSNMQPPSNQPHGMQHHGMQHHGMQPHGMQSPAMQPPGMQPPGMQPPSMQPPAMQPPGMQPPGMQPPAMQPPGMQPPSMQPPAMQSPGMQPPSMQPPSMQPPAMQPPGMQPPGIQHLSMQPSSMQPSSMQSMNMPPGMQPSSYAPVQSAEGMGDQQVAVTYSTENVQQPQFTQGVQQVGSNHGKAFIMSQPQQFQEMLPPLQTLSLSHLPPSVGSSHGVGQGGGYQMQQQQPSVPNGSQQGVPNGTNQGVPNGTHQSYGRQESEPPLISFD